MLTLASRNAEGAGGDLEGGFSPWVGVVFGFLAGRALIFLKICMEISFWFATFAHSLERHESFQRGGGVGAPRGMKLIEL